MVASLIGKRAASTTICSFHTRPSTMTLPSILSTFYPQFVLPSTFGLFGWLNRQGNFLTDCPFYAQTQIAFLKLHLLVKNVNGRKQSTRNNGSEWDPRRHLGRGVPDARFSPDPDRTPIFSTGRPFFKPDPDRTTKKGRTGPGPSGTPLPWGAEARSPGVQEKAC